MVKYLIVIGGATATGKTATAIKLARHFNTEIISADSRQFYREMSIGTAKPNALELSMVKHHFIDSISITQPYSVGDFERDALNCLDILYQKQNVAIVTGGSGLFLRVLCEGMDQFPEVPQEIRLQVDALWQEKGLSWLQAEVEKLDPEYFKVVDQNNPARLRRALEVCLAGNLPYSLYRRNARVERSFTPIYILLELPRMHLYARIDARVQEMIAAGLENEVRQLIPYRHLNALKTVGYEEFFDFFDGNISREIAIEKIQQHSRNYAKRQATWFRKHGNWQIFSPDQYAEILKWVEKEMIG
ncbi:MAG: tRNA (adenosine(37)-N6)-dimethylallyltransferase MiaA [Bacteroidetes bacterium]|nr:tRNA (adenosine(37)-N6)-dimethylallyltransferase MiaA [Bacteroidota bacterium]